MNLQYTAIHLLKHLKTQNDDFWKGREYPMTEWGSATTWIANRQYGDTLAFKAPKLHYTYPAFDLIVAVAAKCD